jgi:hypothetical protein
MKIGLFVDTDFSVALRLWLLNALTLSTQHPRLRCIATSLYISWVRMGHVTDLHQWGEIRVVLDFNVLTKAGQLLR